MKSLGKYLHIVKSNNNSQISHKDKHNAKQYQKIKIKNMISSTDRDMFEWVNMVKFKYEINE